MVTQCNNSKQKRRTSPQITFWYHFKNKKQKIFAMGEKNTKKEKNNI